MAAVDLSQKTVLRIKYNLLWALLYNIVAIPVAAGVLYPATRVRLRPEVAAICMALSSVSVLISSLLLKVRTLPYHTVPDHRFACRVFRDRFRFARPSTATD